MSNSKDIQKEAKVNIDSVKKNLTSMPMNMRFFTLSMRGLYSKDAVGGQSEVAVKFRKLRDDTRDDGVLYLHCLLPMTMKFVRLLNEYFDFYAALGFDDWKTYLSDVVKHVQKSQDVAQFLLDIHKSMMTSLKKSEDKAAVIMQELKTLEQRYEKEAKRLQAEAKHDNTWAFALAFLPGIGSIASAILSSKGQTALAQAMADEQESKIDEAAAVAVKHTLIPAIQHFLNGLSAAAGFFQVVESHLKTFEDFAKEGEDDPMKLYFLMMKHESETIQGLCDDFLAVLPDVQTDFAALPTKDTDHNYVDTWLKDQEKKISAKEKKELQEVLKDVFKQLA